MPPQQTPTAAPSGIRIGDRERAEAAERLSAHAAAGRLRIDELEQRLDRVAAAVYARDLAPLESDLPAIGTAERPHERAGADRRLMMAAVACLLAGVLASALVGHPVPPPFVLAFVLWNVSRRARRGRLGPGGRGQLAASA